jgi:hypothetical protein
MGTPDMLGTYGAYQHFGESNAPDAEQGAGKRFPLSFENDSAKAQLIGPENSFLKEPKPVTIELSIHRDRQADAAVIEFQGRKVVLKTGQWSPWVRLDFSLSLPRFLPNEHVSGICRFYLQEVAPNFKLYVTPSDAHQHRPFRSRDADYRATVLCEGPVQQAGPVLHDRLPGRL